jgi:hypothetical protein
LVPDSTSGWSARSRAGGCRSFWVTIARGLVAYLVVRNAIADGRQGGQSFVRSESSSQRSVVIKRLRSRADPAQRPLSVPNLLALLREAGGPSLQAVEEPFDPVRDESVPLHVYGCVYHPVAVGPRASPDRVTNSQSETLKNRAGTRRLLPSSQCLISNQRIRTIPADNTMTDSAPASATSDITVATRMSAR